MLKLADFALRIFDLNRASDGRGWNARYKFSDGRSGIIYVTGNDLINEITALERMEQELCPTNETATK